MTLSSSSKRLLVWVTLILLGAAFLISAYNEGSLEKTKALVKVKCLGCLGLDPHRGGEVSFWVEYPKGYSGGESWRVGKTPEHPDWILEELGGKRVVVLFFWGEGCEPCARQWEGMRKLGFVTGEERDGSISPAYSENVSLYSMDAGVERYQRVYNVYLPPPGSAGVPMTVVLTTSESGEVLWYSRVGYWEPKEVKEVVEGILAGEIVGAK
ncbi:MAG: hypothetical protein J7L88_04620 [Thermoplasmata archaeon]|nr:hypothetical protein [Thermoplasmata archaeon]